MAKKYKYSQHFKYESIIFLKKCWLVLRYVDSSWILLSHLASQHIASYQYWVSVRKILDISMCRKMCSKNKQFCILEIFYTTILTISDLFHAGWHFPMLVDKRCSPKFLDWSLLAYRMKSWKRSANGISECKIFFHWLQILNILRRRMLRVGIMVYSKAISSSLFFIEEKEVDHWELGLAKAPG